MYKKKRRNAAISQKDKAQMHFFQVFLYFTKFQTIKNIKKMALRRFVTGIHRKSRKTERRN